MSILIEKSIELCYNTIEKSMKFGNNIIEKFFGRYLCYSEKSRKS